jgi:hypothetical protein
MFHGFKKRRIQMKMQRIITLLIFVMIMFMASGTVSAGLIAHYPFNGNANDESVNSNDGTVNGATLTNDRFGNANSAYSFDGTNDYLDIGQNPSLYSQNLTISAWFKRGSTGTIQTILDTRDVDVGSKTYNYHFVLVDDKLYGVFGRTTWAWKEEMPANTPIIDTTDWHHAAMTVMGTTLTYYLDGSTDGSYDIVAPINIRVPLVDNVDNHVDIGRFNVKAGYGGSPDFYWDGLMDDVRIYNRALSSTEITALYNEPIPAPTTIALLGLGYVGLAGGAVRRKWKKKAVDKG